MLRYEKLLLPLYDALSCLFVNFVVKTEAQLTTRLIFEVLRLCYYMVGATRIFDHNKKRSI